ncbi:MAG: hypothetical protein ABIN01_20535 [Ferruginibacter sp.]
MEKTFFAAANLALSLSGRLIARGLKRSKPTVQERIINVDLANLILGEYGTYRRGGTAYVPADLVTHNNAVDHWITYITKRR